eukprot:CAMPEP_0170550072 /NCGR_PEP_ID=MMETSP0211-20121228/8117_1 /TAXON_ID=311385 /ORGANISM="Pseudokeronopsis sp., Strain OXSARD2" /LENGTH=73 /DNA_ID=CAMNT_0010856371 /DNA_START=34 /DNA_END=255 /DNA_ORIENTATION=+
MIYNREDRVIGSGEKVYQMKVKKVFEDHFKRNQSGDNFSQKKQYVMGGGTLGHVGASIASNNQLSNSSHQYTQ